ncbi:MAG: hypothetical protein WCJ30_15465 [Deltaproteobacteria bacterium]
MAARLAAADFWEAPQTMAQGRFPTFFAGKAGPLLVWQESKVSGDSGAAWIRFARFEAGTWKTGNVSDSSYSFSSSSSPPILYSATQAQDGTIAVAIAASGTSIEVKLSRDGGRSFERAGKVESTVTSVAPRIYPSASGGWLVFATQGRPSTTSTGAAPDLAADETAAPSAEAVQTVIMPSSISIYVAKSPDGVAWSPFEPLVAEDIADCIAWAVSRPAHVNIDQIVVRPVTQATASIVARKT